MDNFLKMLNLLDLKLQISFYFEQNYKFTQLDDNLSVTTTNC